MAVVVQGVLAEPANGRKRSVLSQVAALPYRRGDDGQVMVLLVTTRGTGRWIVPKGWPIKQLKGCKAAAREAYEEAGVRGKVAVKAFGRFQYEKRLEDGNTIITCDVRVFPLLVKRQLDVWPEQHQREQRWLPWKVAAATVDDEGLKRLIAAFGATSARAPGDQVA